MRVGNITVGLNVAALHAVLADLGLDYVDKVTVTSTGGADGGLDVVLTTGVAGVEAVACRVDLASDLDPAIARGKVGRLDKAVGENLGAGSLGVGLVAEGNGLVFVGSNIATDLVFLFVEIQMCEVLTNHVVHVSRMDFLFVLLNAQFTCHGRKEEAIAVSRVHSSDLAVDLGSGAHGENSGSSQEEGDRSSVHDYVVMWWW